MLLLIAYTFDLTSSKTQVPSVVLLLFFGWLVRQIAMLTGIEIPDLSVVLPVFGTIGLILILLESSMELELNHSKKKLILKSFFMALLPYVMLSFVLALAVSVLWQHNSSDRSFKCDTFMQPKQRHCHSQCKVFVGKEKRICYLRKQFFGYSRCTVLQSDAD